MISSIFRRVMRVALVSAMAVCGICAPGISALACCVPPTDDSAVISLDLGCATFDWQFAFTEQGYSYLGPVYRIYGACEGNYRACNCNYVPPSTIRGSETIKSSPIDFHNMNVWWTVLNNLPPTYTNCPPGTPCETTGAVQNDRYYIDDLVGYTAVGCP